ncbi:hypothetical protein CO046_05590 [Candidatus Peregrinibacteria bacterium CG_4_9_14_0_2_um_filter_53_11]|nr:MAG: hypothetical protein CO046_05590 [Candidatus Peregrinibacteria bacterium CG_4_9_14_0_2_um_filter_53_11]
MQLRTKIIIGVGLALVVGAAVFSSSSDLLQGKLTNISLTSKTKTAVQDKKKAPATPPALNLNTARRRAAPALPKAEDISTQRSENLRTSGETANNGDDGPGAPAPQISQGVSGSGFQRIYQNARQDNEQTPAQPAQEATPEAQPAQPARAPTPDVNGPDDYSAAVRAPRQPPRVQGDNGLARNQTLNNGLNTLWGMVVSAPQTNEVALKRFVIAFKMPTREAEQGRAFITARDFQLLENGRSINDEISMVTNFGVDLTNPQSIVRKAGFNTMSNVPQNLQHVVNGDEYGLIVVTWDDEKRLSRNETKNYTLTANFSGVAANQDQVEMTFLRDFSGAANQSAGALMLCGTACTFGDPSGQGDMDSRLSIETRALKPTQIWEQPQEQLIQLIAEDTGHNNLTQLNGSSSTREGGTLRFEDPDPSRNYDAVVYFDRNYNKRYDAGQEIALRVDTTNPADMQRLNGPANWPLNVVDNNPGVTGNDLLYLDTDGDGRYSANTDIRFVEGERYTPLMGIGVGRGDPPFVPEGGFFIWSSVALPHHSLATPDWFSGNVGQSLTYTSAS